ncbi:hypothetical protein MHC_03130 [Mycoplasma haemocanis str. Illinois]|uniref:Uncharacterized protein n=1 Tax=Mycoplasma haemocanis (strain Illinois) TaxID=1111676 RepID=H6N764_MYCHN|nr:hypothetical protein [Mycoplasma haemocanis]AEW45486.1 hypothetical protein MHC_03130 [Mycoplasma haemocanis str. Illinois]
MKLKLLGVLSLGVSGTGGWYLFGNIRPKNVEEYLTRSGFKLLSWDSEFSWKAVLEENRDLLQGLLKKSPDIQSIQQWCRDILPREDYEQYANPASLVCVDNLQTIEGKIIQSDGNINALIEGLNNGNKGDKYKVSYVWRKHMSSVLKLISFTPPEKGEGLKEGGEALEKWCKKSLKEKPSDSLLSNVKLLCSPMPFESIEDLIKHNNETNKLASNYETMYEKIKGTDTWTKDPTVLSLGSSGSQQLQKWCERSKSKKFSQEETFSDVYPKFRYRCFNPTFSMAK